MTPWLTKSDFKVASVCATKLFYKKHKYPSALEEDPYMELLAEGGYMVGHLAQLQFPEGVLIDALDPKTAVAQTRAALAAGKTTLFEAAIEWNGCLIRADILRFAKRTIELIEVKSKGCDPVEGFIGARGGIRSDWQEYVEDVAFQRWVVRNSFPGTLVKSFLMTPDKLSRSTIEGLVGMFKIRRDANRAIHVDFKGDPAAIRGTNLLRIWPADSAADLIENDVVATAENLLSFLKGGLRRPPSSPGLKCKACEYRVSAEQKPNGFAECWGDMATVQPSIFELVNLGHVKAGNEALADKLIRERKVSLFDVRPALLTGAHGARQRIQIECTKKQSEWRSPQLKPVLTALSYPLHFVDFETSRLALPYHARMRPWEQVAFQWSCHTIERPGGPLLHSEWINLDEGFPNFAFAASLRAAVGNRGTLLTWSHHEETTLKDIARQIDDYQPEKSELKQWILQTVQSGRIFDLCRHAQQNYYTPAMRGSASIKAVLPAVWRANAQLRRDPWFAAYTREEGGIPASPYSALPTIEIFEQAEVVEEGTGAMRAYQEMLYGAGREDLRTRDAWRKLLLQYCALDTLAMVIIWKHWVEPNP